MVAGVLVTPVHVPLVAPTIVTPAGIVSVNGAVSVSGVVFGLPSVSVSVALPPEVIVPGAIDLASVGAAAFTVTGALAAGAVPAVVARALVVLVTVPGVDEVIVAVIVQPVAAAMLLPDAIVIVVVVLDTPAHVPPVAPTMVTPAGIVSVNGAVSVSGVAIRIAQRQRQRCGTADVIVPGAIDLPSVGTAALTVSGALAAGAVPASVVSAPVVLVTVPASPT